MIKNLSLSEIIIESVQTNGNPLDLNGRKYVSEKSISTDLTNIETGISTELVLIMAK